VTRAVVTIIREQLEEAYDGIRASVDGLTDDEFFWEAVPGCWTVRRRDDGRWTVD
jgi:hypothetical protein